jgi:4-amino-4-deoxy-L-arabinose transferase-like glycosyltransferase
MSNYRKIAMKRINENTVMVALMIIALIPAMTLRDFTPDNELRYLSIADEAIRDGHFFAFYNQYVPYADKPPLYLWLVMLGKLIFGRHVMLFLSLFSVIPALVIMGIMDKWTASCIRISVATRRTGKLMLMTTGLFLGMALTIRMDMLMCMFIVLSLRTFHKMYIGKGRPSDRLLFPIYIFLGIFTKGPIAILVPLVSIPIFLICEGKARTIWHYWGWRTWGVLLLLCGIWFGCVYIEGGQSYLDNLLFNQTVNRAVDSFHHKAPFYYYATSFWYSVAPWCLLIFFSLIAKLKRDYRTDGIERFYIAVALSTTVLLSVISSKIAVYLLPAFPFFVYIAVIDIEKRGAKKISKAAVAVPAVIFVTSLPAVAYIVIGNVMDTISAYIYAAIILCIGGAISLYLLYSKNDIHRAINTISIGLLLIVFIAGIAMPALNDNIGFRNVCTEAKRIAEANDTKAYITYGIRRPESMDVFLDIDVQSVEADDIKDGRHKGAILIAKKKRIDQDEELVQFLAERPQERVGDYIIIVL